MEETKKLSSIPAPDPDTIQPQIRNKETTDSAEKKPGEPKLVGPAPYDSDDVAVAERDSIDYTIKVKLIAAICPLGHFVNLAFHQSTL